MGETKWLPQESELLEREYASPGIQSILATGEIGCLRKAANLIAMKYENVLGKPRPPETLADFHVRKASFKSRTTRAKMTILPAETPEEYASRMNGIAIRIYTWVKYQSDGRVSRAPPSLDDAPAPRSRRITGWDIYKRDRGSIVTAEGKTVTPGAIQEWTALVRAEFEAFSEDVKAGWKMKADKENEAQEANNGASSKPADEEAMAKRDVDRIMHLRRIEDQISGVLQRVNLKTGYVSFSITGGINQHGRLRAFIKCSGKDKYGRDFEQKLEGLSERILERLCNYFEAFMIDCFEWDDEDVKDEGEPKASPEVSWSQRGTVPKAAPGLSRADSVVSSSSMGATSISGVSSVSTTSTTASEDYASASAGPQAESVVPVIQLDTATSVSEKSTSAMVPELAPSAPLNAPAAALSNVTTGPSTPSSQANCSPDVTKRFSPFKSVSSVDAEADEPTPRPTKLFSPFKSVRLATTTPVKLSIQASASAEVASPSIGSREAGTPITPVKLSVQASAAIEPRGGGAELTTHDSAVGSRRERQETGVEDGVGGDGDATPCPRRMTRAKTKVATKNMVQKVSRKTRSQQDAPAPATAMQERGTRKMRSQQDAPASAAMNQERVTRARKASARALQQDPLESRASRSK